MLINILAIVVLTIAIQLYRMGSTYKKQNNHISALGCDVIASGCALAALTIEIMSGTEAVIQAIGNIH